MSRSVNMLLDRLPEYKGDKRLVTRRQDTFDIIREILSMHTKCTALYDRIAEEHWAGNELATARHLFDFMRREVPYKQEKTLTQTVKYPQAILGERLTFGNDCKHYASYIVGIGAALNRLGYPVKCFYRFGCYRDKGGKVSNSPGHVFAVFVIDGREVWIDPVPEIGGFNSRALSPVRTIDKMPAMRQHNSIGSLYEISGFTGNQLVADPHHRRQHTGPFEADRPAHHGGAHWLDTYYGHDHYIGKAKKKGIHLKIKTPHIKIKAPHIKIQPGKLLKKFGAAAPRNAYLALLKLNFGNLAVNIFKKAKTNAQVWPELDAFWKKVGGNPTKLHTAVRGGVNTHNKLHPHAKVSGAGYDDDIYMAGGYTNDHVAGMDEDSMGVVAVAGAAALLAAAAPIIKAISGIFKSLGISHSNVEDAADQADLHTAKDHNDATDDKGDGNKDINPDGSVDHGNGVTTKVETDPDTGKQTIKYDVKDPTTNTDDDDSSTTKTKTVTHDDQETTDDQGNEEDTDTTTKTKTITKHHGGGGGGGFTEMLDNVKNYVSEHKAGVGLTGVGAAALLFSIAHKFPKKSNAPIILGLAGGTALVLGGVQLFKK